MRALRRRCGARRLPRLIDTAASYRNEGAVGRGLARCGVPRDQLFVTSKLWVEDAGYERALAAIDKSLGRLGLDDLECLPRARTNPAFRRVWRERSGIVLSMERLQVCRFAEPESRTRQDSCPHGA